MRNFNVLLVLMLLACSNVLAQSTGVIERGPYAKRPDVVAFLQRVSASHDIPYSELQGILAQGKKLDRVIELMNKPAEGKPWHEYRNIFVTKERINKGVEFWQRHQPILDQAEAVYGVPPEIIVSIIGVETYYGTRMGTFPVLDTLMTLGFDYPKRSAFFLRELEQYLLLMRTENLDAFELVGSYAGAMGMGQFISSSYQRYAVDFDGNGVRDLWNSFDDGIGSVGNYFAAHGWQSGAPVVDKATVKGKAFKKLDADKLKPKYKHADLKTQGVKVLGTVTESEPLSFHILDGKKASEYWVGHQNFYVITRYNHSEKYAMAVYQLAQEILKARNAIKE